MNFKSLRLIIGALSVIGLFCASEAMQSESKKPMRKESSGKISPGGKRKEPRQPDIVHLPSINQTIGEARVALNYLGMLYATMYPSHKQALYYKDEMAFRKTLEAEHAEIIQTLDGTALLVMNKENITIVYGGLYMGKEGTPTKIRKKEGNALAHKFYGIPPTFLVQAGYGKAITGLGRVHRGAYARFALSWDDIYSHIARYAHVIGKPLTEFHYTIVGHSMGGAVAQLAALRLATITFLGKPEDHIRLITFGPARLFDGGLVGLYNGLGLKEYSHAILNQNDTIFEDAPLKLGYATPGLLLTTPAYELENGDPHAYLAYKVGLIKANLENSKLSDPLQSSAGESAAMAKKVVLTPIRTLISGVQKATGKSLIEQKDIDDLIKNSTEIKKQEIFLKLIRSGAYKSEEEAVAHIGQGNPERSGLVRKAWAQLHQEVTE